ncbi:excalibur calcium-binding domain-containing protein [Micropruina sp.]|uniref:excalibur calcium-binding domain-containing protein n=1 Tax=Micropruina sp. TaxID=2737536 RepID=UPI0039E27B34
MRTIIFGIAAAGIGLTILPVAAPAAQAATPQVTEGLSAIVLPQSASKYKFQNCTALNKVYKHGVGKNGAKDHTSGRRVTNFKHSTSLYKKIIGHRQSLDRDKDGIACEKG